MKKSIFFIIILTIIFATQSCKKEVINNNTVADSYVGIWSVKDSSFFSGSTSADTYNMTISKRDANSIYMINFHYSDTTIFNVTETALAYLSDVSGTAPFWFSSFAGTKNSNTITFTMEDNSVTNITYRGIATKL